LHGGVKFKGNLFAGYRDHGFDDLADGDAALRAKVEGADYGKVMLRVYTADDGLDDVVDETIRASLFLGPHDAEGSKVWLAGIGVTLGERAGVGGLVQPVRVDVYAACVEEGGHALLDRRPNDILIE
jgi:hypothetical protein